MSRSAMSASAAGGAAAGTSGGDPARSATEEQEGGGHGAGSSGFRSGLMMTMEGDSSAFGPLGQIEENGGGTVEDMELEHEGGAASSRQQQVRAMDVCTAIYV